MTAPVLADPLDPGRVAVQNAAKTYALHDGFGVKPNFFKKDDGSHVYQGVAVFRSGTFSDSMGYENTWEEMHLNQMVTNWEHLRNNGTFENVPVRDGHPGWLINGTPGTGKVVGWHTALKVEKRVAPHDGAEYSYLLADYEILDEEAKAAIESGLWRNRSSEIGTYLTNNKAEHWPVYMGVAYVDIPAVEGLNFSAQQTSGHTPRVYVMFDNSKEKSVGDNPAAAPQQGTQQPSTAPAATAQHGAPAATAAPAAPAFVFKVNGLDTSDFASVQAHITALEGFRSDTTKSNRENFVTALAAANKIPATQLDEFKNHVVGLTPEGFESFSKLYGEVDVPALLAKHVTPASNDGGQSPAQHGAQQATATEVVILKEQIAMHKAAGTPRDTIKKMPVYTKLIALDPAFVL